LLTTFDASIHLILLQSNEANREIRNQFGKPQLFFEPFL